MAEPESEIPSIVPRAYQNEIFEQAVKNNILCAMDTGSGKTFIAVMLTKWMCAQPQNNDKRVVFLVPKVPLVVQQTSVFKNQTPLPVRGYYGDLGVDNWDRSAWTAEFKEHHVLVMTAQIFYNILTHAHWTMDKISLLIFDEVHHCQKKHPYAKIMTDHYYRYAVEQRPKIFGLTASPIWNAKNPSQSLRALETTTNARVVAIKQNMDELQTYSPRPAEHEVFFSQCAEALPELWSEYPTPWLWHECAHFLESSSDIESVARRRGKYQALFDAIGPYGADYWVFLELQKAIDGRKDPDAAIIELQNRNPNQIHPFQLDRDSGLRHAREIYDRHKVRFQDDRTFYSSWMSPKLIALLELLISTQQQGFQGIIFTDQRHIATILAWVLQRLPETKDWIRCASLTGHGISGSRYAELSGAGMHFKRQHDIVAQFRNGSLNLVVATDVAEEGLDFQACNVIIRFDPLKTVVGYIQSRGRARRPDSVYIVMQPEVGRQYAGYRQMYKVESDLKRRYRERSSLAPILDDEEDGRTEEDDPMTSNEICTIPSSGATLTAYASIPLLSNLCAMVPRDSFCPVFKPEWKVEPMGEGHYQAEVTLPSVLPLDPKDRVFPGPIRRGKKSAKSSAAFIAMRRLCSLEIFDDKFLPGRLQQGDNALDADGRGIVKISDMLSVLSDARFHDAFGSVWDPSSGLWLHQLTCDGHDRMGLVSSQRLEPFSDMFPALGDPTVHIELTSTTELTWSSDHEKSKALHLMGRYTAECIRVSIYGRNPPLDPCELPIFLVPTGGSGVDCEAMQRALVRNPSNQWPSSDTPDGNVLFEAIDEPGRMYALVAVRNDLSPLSRPPETSREGDYQSYLEYWKEKRRKDIPEDQPLLELKLLKRHIRMSSTLHRILPGYSEPPFVTEKVFLIPRSMCRPASLPLYAFKLYRLFPAVVQHLNDLHRVRKLRHDLCLIGMDTQHLVEALTIPAAGANYSFQRLETMGDAVLKLATNVHVFNKFPYRHEGQLDILRSNSVNNRFLLGRAREIHLETYLIAENIVPKWLPPNPSLIYTDEKGQKFVSKQRLNTKSMADVMEALTGASFLCGGIDLALYTGTRLGLCFGGDIPWPQRNYNVSTQEDERSAAIFRPLEDSLRYSFRNRHLLIEALTHPTFFTKVSYQRLEFLGDDLLVTKYLFLVYPNATPGQITWAKSRSVCNPTLGTLSARSLSLQKYMLSMSPKLEASIQSYIEHSKDVPYAQLVVETWNWDPPKPLCDLFEAVIGAIFVDTGFDLQRTFEVLEPLISEVLSVVSPNMPRDPITELMIWSARGGCIRTKFKKCRANGQSEGPYDSYSVYVHDIDVTGPVKSNTLLLSKYHSATRAHILLQDESSPLHLPKLCHCKSANESAQTLDGAPRADQSNTTEDIGESMLKAALVKLERDSESWTQKVSDETTEGYAICSQILTRLYTDLDSNIAEANESDDASDE